MMGLLFLLCYLTAGQLMARNLLPRLSPLARLMVGLALSLFLLMWLPALLAFVRAYDALSQWLSLLPLALLCGLSFFNKDQQPARMNEQDKKALRLVFALVLPLFLISCYLQTTHVLRPQDGALYTGQSTFGDLPLHLSIMTGLKGSSLPADYSILPGARLGYPFLADSLSTSLLCLGFDLRSAAILPACLMLLVVYLGAALLFLEACRDKRAAALAFLFVFINGGLGFLYAFDMAGVSLGGPGENQLQAGTWFARIDNILNGWYQTPANHAEFSRYNLRMSNLVADLLTPQRTFLAGWAMLIPCLYLLVHGMKQERFPLSHLLVLGLLAGGLPLIHTHSFLALGLMSLSWFVITVLKKQNIRPWLIYGGVALLLSLPQLLFFTLRQSSAEGFLRFQFNWVNNLTGRGLQDAYLWFYLKNIGLPFLLLLLALFEKNPWHKRLFLGALTIILVAETLLFQPNPYDNNKLLYVAWLLCAIPAADYALTVFDRLRGLRARPILATLALFVALTSGTLSIAREINSDFMMFSKEDVALANFVSEHTPQKARFVTGTQHLNPVSSLAGREIILGPDLWLYYHGFDTRQRQQDLHAFYQNPQANADFPARYQAGYVLLGPEEVRLGGTRDSLAALYPLVYDTPDYLVFEVPEEGR